MIRIGPHTLDNPVALAPMAGVTDLPFRTLCRKLGAGLVVSEMITSDISLWNSRKSSLRLDHGKECEPRSVQIAGAEATMMAEAARCNAERGADIIDINMGCPAKKVCRKAAGSALLRDEKLVAEILSAVVNAVSIPVTLKIRTGWSPDMRNGAAVARVAEDCGIAALAVHGRTRSCRFNGEAEYETTAEICSAVAIPVFANGDIDSPHKAQAVMEFTAAAGVMVGRAAQGRPWLCGQIAHFLQTGQLRAAPGQAEQLALMCGHLQSLYDFYGEYTGVRVARKHLGWYLQNDSPENDTDKTVFRRQFNARECAQEQLDLIKHYFRENRLAETGFEERAA